MSSNYFDTYLTCAQTIKNTGVEVYEESTKDAKNPRAVYFITFRLFGFCGATMTLDISAHGASLAYRFEDGISEDGQEMQMYGWIIRHDRPVEKVMKVVLELIELSKTDLNPTETKD